MPGTIPAAQQAQLRARAVAAIADVVTPAYRRFQQYFDRDYLPRCRTTIAAETLPDGKAYYAYQVREYTTTDLTPEQIHQTGLRKVAEIHADMERVFKKIGFKGSYQDFLHFLRTDPRFYYKDPQHLLEAYRAAAKRVDPLLVQYFPVWLLPRVTYGVRPIPAALAPDTYPAYSVPPAGDGSVAGYIDVNLYKPESRPKYDIQVLTCHEGRPGHQLQIAIAMELKGLPEFRRFDYYSSYGEGWALYTESLCNEMGLYGDPYSEFGYLDWQMWRAVRLVVDTGIHSQGWSRERAVKYFEDNTALSAAEHQHGGGPLHRMAGAGAVVHDRRDRNPDPASAGRAGAGAELQDQGVPRRRARARSATDHGPQERDRDVDRERTSGEA